MLPSLQHYHYQTLTQRCTTLNTVCLLSDSCSASPPQFSWSGQHQTENLSCHHSLSHSQHTLHSSTPLSPLDFHSWHYCHPVTTETRPLCGNQMETDGCWGHFPGKILDCSHQVWELKAREEIITAATPEQFLIIWIKNSKRQLYYILLHFKCFHMILWPK